MKRVYLHYHRPDGRVVTHDLSPPTLEDQYRDLAERLQAALAVQGHSTDPSLRIAAGVAIYDLSGAVLLLKRRPDCDDHPGEWAFPAGGIDPGETPEQCARREAWEETGRRPLILKPLGIYEEPGVCFHGFKEQVVGRFNPRLCREHTEFKWSTPEDRPKPLHPGVAKMLRLAKAPTKDDANPQDPEGKWITLNGAHVFINKKGEITKGPPHLVGKHKDDVGGKGVEHLTPAKKGVKNVVHELLSTGHEWHFDELKSATGAKLDQQLHNALNELKAGKGSLGQLTIKKTGPKTYQVVGPDGEPVAGLPKADSAAAEAAKVIEQAKKPQEAAAEPAPPQPPAQEPIVAPEPPPAAPSAPSAPTGKAPATKMTVAEADAAYAQHLKALNDQAAAAITDYYGDDTFDPANETAYLKAAAQNWKEGKSLAMAQWAANVKGSDHAPKPVEVFPEDVKLMKDLGEAAGMDQPYDKAISDWKAATAKAKYAPKVAPASVSPEQAAAPMSKPKEPEPPAPPVDVSSITPVLEPPKTVVPDDHDHISPEHFASGEYQEQIKKAHDLLHGSSLGDAVANKVRIQKNLDAKLKASEHFKDIEAQYLKANPNAGPGKSSLAARLISQWATSSGNHHSISVASQLAIADAFKMAPEHVETKAFHLLHGDVKGDHDTVYKMAATELGIKSNTPESMAKFKAGLRDFALAQYHATQDHLASLGIKELHLIRGMKFGEHNGPAKPVDIKLQPASSFTTNHSTAVSFAGTGSLFMVKVPASQVMSSFITGYGCTNESEVVVLNHPGMKAIQIGAGNGTDTTTLVKNVNSALNPGLAPPAAADPSKPKIPDHGFTSTTYQYWGNKVKEAALAGESEFNALHTQLKESGSMLKIEAYADQVKQALDAHKAKAAPQVPNPGPIPKPEEHGASPTFGSVGHGLYELAQKNGVTALKEHLDFYSKQPPTSETGKANAKYAQVLYDHLTGAKPTATPAAAATPKKTGGSFAPKNLPPVPVGVGKKTGPAMLKLAKAGDIEGVKKLYESLADNMPNTKKYGGILLAELNVQHKAHLEAQALKAASAPAGGVKKNAHYYKKLKEKVLSHPHHGDAIYTSLKNAGMTNEQILDTYNKAHKAMFGAEA